MSDPRSRSLEWIEQAKQHVPGVSDTPLVEKAIRALSLLESLVRSGCPFIFKGGTALMLHLDTTRRLSIDVDIVCPPGTDIKEYLVRLIQTGTNQVKHYSPEMDTELAAADRFRRSPEGRLFDDPYGSGQDCFDYTTYAGDPRLPELIATILKNHFGYKDNSRLVAHTYCEVDYFRKEPDNGRPKQVKS